MLGGYAIEETTMTGNGGVITTTLADYGGSLFFYERVVHYYSSTLDVCCNFPFVFFLRSLQTPNPSPPHNFIIRIESSSPVEADVDTAAALPTLHIHTPDPADMPTRISPGIVSCAGDDY